MSSLPFSVGHYTTTPRRTQLLTTISNFNKNTSLSSPNFPILHHNHHEQEGENPAAKTLKNPNPRLTTRRREAIGLGLSIGFISNAVNFLQTASASAAETDPPCEFTVSPSGLAFCDKFLGTGQEATKGQLIKAHYVGRLENGQVFDSSYNRGKPLTFRVGVNEVIKGWDQGIVGGEGVPPMLAGGRRTLKIPPQLGYGIRGAGCKGGSCIIPPDSVLLFDVLFIGKAT